MGYSRYPLAIVSAVNGLKELENNPPEVSLPFGNTIVERLSGSLIYTREGETGNVNLSSVPETLLEDEIAIAENGVSVYGEHDNELSGSENFLNTAWTPTRLTPTDNGDGWFKLEITDDSSFSRLQQNVTTTIGAFCVFMKAGNVSGASLRIEGGINSSNDIALDEHGVTHCKVTDASVVNVQVFPHSGGPAGAGSIGDFVYIKFAQLTETSYPVPYKSTTTSPETRFSDRVSIPMMNSLPAPGRPFSIVIDSADIPTSATANAFIWAGDTLFYARRQVNTGAIQFATGAGTATTAGNFDTSENVRFIFVYDGVNAIIYANGVLVAINTSGTPVYNLNNQFSIGSYYTFIQPVNTELKGLGIYHHALSPNAAFALGAA